jgi:hypothetical protein
MEELKESSQPSQPLCVIDALSIFKETDLSGRYLLENAGYLNEPIEERKGFKLYKSKASPLRKASGGYYNYEALVNIREAFPEMQEILALLSAHLIPDKEEG